MNTDYSVVLAVKNAEEYLQNALVSVYSQSLVPKEVIVVDDNSDDETKNIAMKFGARVINNKGIGQAAGLNTGIQCCTTKLIAFLDHDDLWHLNKQELQVDLILSEDEVDYVVGEVVNFDGRGLEKNMGLSRVLGACTFTMEFVQRVGNFNEDLNHHAIVEWWSRVGATNAKWKGINQPLFYRLIHGKNTTTVAKDEAKKALLIAIRMGLHSRRD